MKLAPDALIEYRCDCGKLAGYLVRRDGVLELVTTTSTFGAVSEALLRFIPEERVRARVESNGRPVCCGRHDRVIRGAGVVTPTKGRRRKVILSPVDDVDFATTPAALSNMLDEIERRRSEDHPEG